MVFLTFRFHIKFLCYYWQLFHINPMDLGRAILRGVFTWHPWAHSSGIGRALVASWLGRPVDLTRQVSQGFRFDFGAPSIFKDRSDNSPLAATTTQTNLGYETFHAYFSTCHL